MRLIRIAVLASAALLPLSASACTATSEAADATPIVIGADLELSGADAAIGLVFERALHLKVDQINAKGGVDGHPLRLDPKDNRSDPTVSVTNVNALTNNPAVAAIVTGACSPCSLNIAKIVEEKQIPTVSLAPATEVTHQAQPTTYLFKLGPNADDSAAALTTELRNAGIHTIGLLSTDDLDGKDAATAMARAPKALTVVAPPGQTFKATDTDLSQPVHAVVSKHPEALVISAFPAQAALAAQAARDDGYTGRIFFNTTAAGELFLIGAAATAAEGAIMVAPQTLVIDDVIATTPAKTARKQWFNDYTSKYGAFSGFSAYAADAVRLITDAIHSAGGPNRRRMRDLMEVSSFDGLSGQIRFAPGNHSGMMPQSLTTVVARSGRWRLLG